MNIESKYQTVKAESYFLFGTKCLVQQVVVIRSIPIILSNSLIIITDSLWRKINTCLEPDVWCVLFGGFVQHASVVVGKCIGINVTTAICRTKCLVAHEKVWVGLNSSIKLLYVQHYESEIPLEKDTVQTHSNGFIVTNGFHLS